MSPTAMLETTRKRPRRRRSIAGSAARVSAIGPSVFSCSICEATSDDVSSASECWLQPDGVRIEKLRSGSPVLGRARSAAASAKRPPTATPPPASAVYRLRAEDGVLICSICEATAADAASASECWLQPADSGLLGHNLGTGLMCSIWEAILPLHSQGKNM